MFDKPHPNDGTLLEIVGDALVVRCISFHVTDKINTVIDRSKFTTTIKVSIN